MDENEKTVVAKVIDEKIAELTAEAAELQKTIARFASVQMNLNSLRQTRAALLGGDASTPPIGQPQAQIIIRPAPVTSPPPTVTTKTDEELGSVGSLTLEILKELNGPVHLPTLLQRLRGKGKSVNYRTLSSVLSQYVARGLIQRLGPGIYGLPGGDKTSSSGTSS